VAIIVKAPVMPNDPPTVAVTQPAAGAAFEPATQIEIIADAADLDGQVSKVEFYAGAIKLGEAVSAPYRLLWSPASSGTVAITAAATDDRGARVTTAAVNITILAGAGGTNTVTLQRGTAPNAAVADLYLSSYHKTTNLGASTSMQDQREYYSNLLRFAIFQSEGGPVPDGAQIISAQLSLYKYSNYDMVYGLHRVLRDWSESAATWNQRLAGQPWSAPGASAPSTAIAAISSPENRRGPAGGRLPLSAMRTKAPTTTRVPGPTRSVPKALSRKPTASTGSPFRAWRSQATGSRPAIATTSGW
jgi:hypothetical protein